MRLLESAPERYDLGIRLLTLGRIDSVYARVARLLRGPDVLDLGCGTGNLTVRLSRRGFQVTGLDASPEMLDVARRKVLSSATMRWVHASAVELIDHFAESSFDSIASVLMFSELSDDEQRLVFRQCLRLLRPGGLFLVADETRPPAFLRRVFHNLIRTPLAAATYALTQTSTSPVRGLRAKVGEAGFGVMLEETSWLGDFTLLTAEKREA